MRSCSIRMGSRRDGFGSNCQFPNRRGPLLMNLPDNHPSFDEFAQLVIARLQETGVTGEISYDPEEFEISVAGEIKSVLYLGNAYRDYCSCSDKDRPESLRRF